MIKPLKLEEAKTIAGSWFRENFNVSMLDKADHSRITFLYTVKGDLAVCRFIIPGPLPEDARVLAELTIHRHSRHVTGRLI